MQLYRYLIDKIIPLVEDLPFDLNYLPFSASIHTETKTKKLWI